ncbi:MAG: type VI secretion system baseplate subunit TssG [Pseudomonadales bacterium]
MAGAGRTSTQALKFRSQLERDPYGFEFYQALRLLEALNADKPRLGESSRAVHEGVRLTQEPSMAFASSMVSGFSSAGEGGKDRLEVLFMGLFGPNGPLPLHLTEYARQRDLQFGDKTFRRFADLFHHRMLSLFYRAWANAQPCINFDRAGQDKFFDYVGSLIGLGQTAARNHDALNDHARLYFSGILGMQNSPAAGLETIVEEYLQVSSQVEEFVGEWVEIPADLRLLLGRSTSSGTLGDSATAGARAWSVQSKFRLICGPMGFEEFRRLLPDRDSLGGLAGLVRSYVGDTLAWELNLVLRGNEVPQMRLGESGNLGWTSWLGTREESTDAGEVLLWPAEMVA